MLYPDCNELAPFFIIRTIYQYQKPKPYVISSFLQKPNVRGGGGGRTIIFFGNGGNGKN